MTECARHKVPSSVSLKSAVERFKGEKCLALLCFEPGPCSKGGSSDHCHDHYCPSKIKDSVIDWNINVRPCLMGKGRLRVDLAVDYF